MPEYEEDDTDKLMEAEFIFLDLAKGYINSCDFKTAKTICKAVIASSAENVFAWDTLGLAYYRQGDHGKAIRAWSKSLSLGDYGEAKDYLLRHYEIRLAGL